jgi:glycosyltransferase involved in cell wall biosynthesis
VEIVSLPWRNYAAHLSDNLRFRLPPHLDLLLQDELNHPSFLTANRRPHPYPLISLVHHLRCSEQRPGWQNWFYRFIEKRYLESVDGFIFNSETTKRVVNSLLESSRPNIVALPPTDRFRQGMTIAEIEARAREPGPLRILFLGNVIHRKGLHALIEAINVGQIDNLSYRLDVVGSLNADPAYAREIQKRVEASRFQFQVSFHDAVEDDQLIAKLKSAHVLAVPSSYEGFGIVYLEGMAFGLPAIGSIAGGASEIIHDGENGFLIRPNDAALLAERLSMLAKDRDLLTRFSIQALERYRQQPAWEQTAGNIREFLLGFL